MPYNQAQLENYVTYGFDGPRLNRDVPANKIAFTQQSQVSGVDGRFKGCLHKYYGNRLLVDLDGVTGLTTIDAYDGVSFLQEVVFQKRGTSTIYRGFVIRWDKGDDTDNSEVGLVYSDDNGSTWAYLAVIAQAASGITKTTALEAMAHGAYLMVAVEGKATKTAYWSGSALVAVDSGPGSFGVVLGALTEGTQAEDTSYHLDGNGVYEVRWRFYSSTRGIYSSISSALTVYMDKPKLTAAHGAVYFASTGGDSGLMVEGDILTLNSRTFEYISAGSNVTIPVAAAATVAAHAAALADAINGDTANCGCTARAETTSVYIEASTAGTAGNTIDLSIAETGANTDDISVSGANLTGGGEVTAEYLKQCKVTLDFPANTSVVSGKTFADFAALFDTIDVFRTIDLGQIPAAQEGGIFWLEQSIAKTGNWASSGAFDSLQVVLGTLPDAALVQQDSTNMYDPSRDAIQTPPQSGTIGRYQGATFMAQATSDDEPYSILASSLTHTSPEYFTSYYVRKGNAKRGRPTRFLVAGDSCFALHPGGFVHIYKPSNDAGIRYVDTITGPGLDGKWAAHIMGNSILMFSAGLLRTMGGNDGNIVDLPGVQGLLTDDWATHIEDYVSCGYDARMNVSMFLNPQRDEILCLWHGTGCVSMLEGANFVWMTDGPDITGGDKQRIYMVTKEGLVVSPDYAQAGSGTMFDLSSSYTLAGAITSGSETTTLMTGATFHAAMVGSYLYYIDGPNAGLGRVISSVDVGNVTLTTAAFPESPVYGNRFCVSPVPLFVTLPPIRTMNAPESMVNFDRQKMIGASVKFQAISGLEAGVTDTLRIGAYRNMSTTLESTTFEVDVSSDIAEASGSFGEDGVIGGLDILPYLEYIGVGSVLEITDVQVSKPDLDSKADQ
jgi:hypothetical protein